VIQSLHLGKECSANFFASIDHADARRFPAGVSAQFVRVFYRLMIDDRVSIFTKLAPLLIRRADVYAPAI